MKSPTLFAIALALLLANDAMAFPQQESATQGAAQVGEIADAQSFLAEVDESVQRAREGLYGSISAANVKLMMDSRDRIHALLAGHQSSAELTDQERIELFNAQETLASVIRNDAMDRKICKRVLVSGSRRSKYECLTEREREERRRSAKESTERQQRVVCTKGVQGC